MTPNGLDVPSLSVKTEEYVAAHVKRKNVCCISCCLQAFCADAVVQLLYGETVCNDVLLLLRSVLCKQMPSASS